MLAGQPAGSGRRRRSTPTAQMTCIGLLNSAHACRPVSICKPGTAVVSIDERRAFCQALCRPRLTSHNRTPYEYASQRSVICEEAAMTSGAMYAAVPQAATCEARTVECHKHPLARFAATNYIATCKRTPSPCQATDVHHVWLQPAQSRPTVHGRQNQGGRCGLRGRDAALADAVNGSDVEPRQSPLPAGQRLRTGGGSAGHAAWRAG
jgi:hypothetical protein